MSVDPVNTSKAAAGGTAAQGAMNRLSGDYDNFLKLLTAQVSNQDPLEPMDSSTFVTQLAQLSQVEQSIVTNSNLEGIAGQLSSTGALSDVALVGREVQLATDTIELRDGSAAFQYELAEPAESVTARILTEDGTLVREIDDLPTAAEGPHDVSWDGIDRSGLPVPDSRLKVEIEAKNAAGEPITWATYAATQVEELNFAGGTPMLVLRNGEQAYSGDLRRVR